MTTYTAQIEVASDLVNMGQHDEDGSDITGTVFYVTATRPNGQRFVHAHTFGPVTRNRQDAVLAEAQRLADRVVAAQAAGKWNGPNAHWTEVQPAYGSEAYAANWREYAEADAAADAA